MRHKISQIMVLISFLIIMTATIPLGYAYEWSPDMELTWNNNSDGNPSIAQASDGKIWVVWNSYRTGNAEIFYKVYDSSKVHPWSLEKNLTANPNVDKTPSIMQAKDGKIWVVWSTNRDGNYKIYYKTSSDNGATWSPDQNLTAIQNPKDDEHPSIMQTANGTIWLAWSANRTGNYEIYYKTSPDNGTTWSTDKFLSYLETTDDRNPSITQTADDKIYFVWVTNKDIDQDGDPDLNIWYTYYYYSFLLQKWKWSGIHKVTNDTEVFNLNPSITQTADVVWNSDKVGNQTDLYYRNLLSGELPTRLTINQGDDFAPSIMQAADGTIWIVWAAYRADNFDIHYMTTEIPQSRDVAIFSVIPSKAAVYQGQTVSIEVVAQNHGTNDENFIVRCYAGSTLINETTIGLSPGELYPMTSTWNAPNTGTYTISANASTVPDETNTADNTFIDATVHVKILGDVNGDQTVNASDLSALSNAYGSKPGDLNWDPNCNLYVDNKVDVYDLFDLGKNYGKSQ